ncbi:MAG: DUF234 domain-containing protein, partial [Clostridiales bacterium]|nr:DUF234 domain-containing protein [Clostridiales bacterium]
FPNLSGVTNNLGRVIFGTEIEDELPAYMGLVFEEICKQYLYEQAKIGALPLLPGKLGRWWGASKEKRQEEIDIVTSRKDIALFCECKWKNALVDVDSLSSLAKKAELFQYKETWLWLFSKTGFTERLCNEALNRRNVRFIGFDEMF